LPTEEKAQKLLLPAGFSGTDSLLYSSQFPNGRQCKSNPQTGVWKDPVSSKKAAPQLW
jgi:hypothetical protein